MKRNCSSDHSFDMRVSTRQHHFEDSRYVEVTPQSLEQFLAALECELQVDRERLAELIEQRGEVKGQARAASAN